MASLNNRELRLIELALENFADGAGYSDVEALNGTPQRDATDEDCENVAAEAQQLQEKIQRMRGG